MLAAFGVILIHLAPATPAADRVTDTFALFAVPYFFIMALYFRISRIFDGGERGLFALKLDRILVPHRSWTLIYLALLAVKAGMSGSATHMDLTGAFLFGASAVHLYFLPLLVIYLMVIEGIALFVMSPRNPIGAILMAGLAAGIAIAGTTGHYFGFGDALTNGCLYCGLALVLCVGQRTTLGRRFNVVAGVLTIVLVSATAVLGVPTFATSDVCRALAGYGVAACALNAGSRIKSTEAGDFMTSSFGVYLCHFAILEGIEFILVKSGHPAAPYSLGEKLFYGALIFALGCAFVAMGRRSHMSAYLLFWERYRIPALREDQAGLTRS
jgi:fucose 4-O-acetylase-like acetyltransferase